MESHAESVGQLWAVLHGAQFGSEFFAFGWGQILRLRVPLVARLAWAEFGIAGSLLLLAGLVLMWRRRAREAAFLALGLLAVAFFALTYDVSDTEVFLIPGFVLAWIVIGWMLERIVPDSGRARTVVLVAACLLLPGWQLVRNYRQNDAHAERFEIEFFQTLFAQLPERAAIVTEPAAIHWMLTYELEAEHAQRDRDVRLIAEDERTIRRLAQQGFQVFTFEGARGRLQDRGLLFVPLPLPRRPGSTIDLRARPVFRLSEVSRCAAVVSSGWTELTDVAKLTGGRLSLRVEEAPEGSAGLRLWGSRQLPACGRAAEDARLPACAPVVARTRGDDVTLCSPDDRRAVCAAPAVAAPPAASAPSASLVTLAVGTRSSALLDLPAGGDGLWARTTRGRVEMCPDPLLGREVLPNGSDVDSIDVGGGQDAYFGRGWLPVADQAGALRWAAAPGADLAIPLAAAGSPIRVVLSGSPPGPEAGGRVRIAVNGRLLDERGLRGGLSEYAWEVPAEAWRRGLNDLRVLLSGGPPAPQPAFGIERIRLFRLGSAPPPAGR